jgi:hypothetical protein
VGANGFRRIAELKIHEVSLERNLFEFDAEDRKPIRPFDPAAAALPKAQGSRRKIASLGFVTPPRACGILSSPVAKRMKKISYRGYRFSPEIIYQAIWLYLRFTLCLRDVEDLLAERGVALS